MEFHKDDKTDWNSPGAMGEYEAYRNGFYLEIWNVEPDSDVVGYRWEVRRENDWLDTEPLCHGLAPTVEQAKREAEREAI